MTVRRSQRHCLRRVRALLLPLLALLLTFSVPMQGQTFETMFADNKGINPSGGLVKGNDGNFYGTTYTGGIFDQGTMFKITPAGELTTLVTFGSPNGSYPRGGLVKGSDGAFYGSTSLGGANVNGTVFKVTPTGELTTLVAFNHTNGSSPQGRLVQGSDGAFYGTTYSGGGSNGGTVFKVTPAGEFTTLVSFNGSNGSNPNAGLIKGSDGAFYGTTSAGGANSKGTAFKMTAAGVLTTLISFDGTNGSAPSGGLLEGSDGVFYGTTTAGGANGSGTVFKMTSAGVLTTLISFDGSNGGNPLAGLVKGSNGVFYGVTRQGGVNGYGTVFKLTEAGELTTLLSFDASKGVYPSDELLEGDDGVLYGTTAEDPGNNAGTVFKMTFEGELTTLVNFNNTHGAFPYARLLEGGDGAFYGTTSEGGVYNKGTVFKVTRNGERMTLVDFNGTNGATPYAGLVEGSDGAFYGTTRSGGASDRGTVFKVTAAGVLTRLASFNSTHGGGPRAALVKGSDGAFYGTTYGIISLGGSRHHGTVFKVTPSGALTTLVLFDGANGTDPSGELVEGSGGAFYGTTTAGGSGERGTVFKVTPARVLTTLVSFDGTNGASPQAGLLKGSDGAFYGTTAGGGAFNAGTVFKVTSAGALTTLASFNRTNGYAPRSGLVEGADGAFYGATTAGGMHGRGTVFKLLTAHRYLMTLHSFDGTKAANPRGTPIFSSDGDLYGTANQMAIWRVVFSSAPAVTTDAADAVSATGATLHGSVIPNGGSTKVWFEYGTTTAYGSTTAVQDIGAGSTSLAVSQSLMLLPHTTYHFRVVAQNAKGTTYGEDQSFTTLNSIPIATADVVDGAYGRAVPVPVLTNDTDADGDTLTVLSFTQPSHGRVIRAGTDSNRLVYIPQLGFSGVDSFTYTVSDGRSAALTGNVEITVGARPAPSSSVALDTEAPVPGAGEQGSGIPSGATWRIFGVPAINDAGQVAVLGTWKSPEGSGSGIFVDEQLVVKTGDPVPGLASFTFKSFTDPVLNEAGRVAFRATITGPGVRKNNDTVLVTTAFSGELELVAREGDVAAETAEARFGRFYNISLLGDSSENAGLLFTAALLRGRGNPRVNPTSDLGAWLRISSLDATPRKVVQEGDPGFAWGEKIKSFQLLQSLRGSPGQGRGHYKADEVSFAVTLTSKRQALVRFRSGALEEEAVTGELLGAALPDAKWRSFGLPVTDGTGMVSAVRATLQTSLGGVSKANATGIFVSIGTGGGYAPVVRVGDEAFSVAGARFSVLGDPLVSGWNPGVAFIGSIRGQGVRGHNNTGIWWQTLSGSTLVARAGMQATEAPEGARWKSFSSLALPDGERGPLFVATLAKGAGAVNTSNDTGLWAVDSVGEVRLLVRERDPVGEKTLKSFSTLQAVSGSSGVRRSFNNAGQVVYRAYFTDGSQGVIKVQVP